MTPEPVLQPEPEWYADDMDSDMMFVDDDLDLNDMPDNDDPQGAEPAGDVPVWRLIEMSRESRHLARELADFEDYDFMDSDSLIDDYAGEFRH